MPPVFRAGFFWFSFIFSMVYVPYLHAIEVEVQARYGGRFSAEQFLVDWEEISIKFENRLIHSLSGLEEKLNFKTTNKYSLQLIYLPNTELPVGERLPPTEVVYSHDLQKVDILMFARTAGRLGQIKVESYIRALIDRAKLKIVSDMLESFLKKYGIDEIDVGLSPSPSDFFVAGGPIYDGAEYQYLTQLFDYHRTQIHYPALDFSKLIVNVVTSFVYQGVLGAEKTLREARLNHVERKRAQQILDRIVMYSYISGEKSDYITYLFHIVGNELKKVKEQVDVLADRAKQKESISIEERYSEMMAIDSASMLYNALVRSLNPDNEVLDDGFDCRDLF